MLQPSRVALQSRRVASAKGHSIACVASAWLFASTKPSHPHTLTDRQVPSRLASTARNPQLQSAQTSSHPENPTVKGGRGGVAGADPLRHRGQRYEGGAEWVCMVS
ncbi:unnamed protein product [Diplocarpon coronariae]|nr:hypothetical protein JHW43_006744 [Diplocarpon mali]